tara:strand:+ start:18 stop:812 length:795 start_codon:yes stop_codon:yes gene_type:complete
MLKESTSKKISKIYGSVAHKKSNSKARIENTFGLLERILNFITPPIAHVLNKFNISADLVTIISFVFIASGSVFFLQGNSLLGSINWLIVGLLDSLDGDLARLRKKETLYGNTLDSFGSDIFYFTFPFVIGFYLFFYTDYNVIFYTNFDILILSFVTSFTLTGYRIIGSKRYILFLKEKKLRKAKLEKKFLNLKKNYKKIDNEAVRINLFGEPGIILNFLIISLIDRDLLYYYYLILISAYSILRFFKSIVSTYISFKNMNKIK